MSLCCQKLKTSLSPTAFCQANSCLQNSILNKPFSYTPFPFQRSLVPKTANIGIRIISMTLCHSPSSGYEPPEVCHPYKISSPCPRPTMQECEALRCLPKDSDASPAIPYKCRKLKMGGTMGLFWRGLAKRYNSTTKMRDSTSWSVFVNRRLL